MIEIIPAIDLIGGECVRLSQGDYALKKVYSSSPVEVALQFEAAGIRRLHLVDLDGAKQGRVVNLSVLEAIASQTKLVIDFSGGVRGEADVEAAFSAGARYVSIGSLAVKDPDRFISWLERYGRDRFILGADVRDGFVAISGWQDTTDRELLPFVEKFVELGVVQVICTEISKDGLLQGPATSLYAGLREAFPSIGIIASGGVSSLEDVRALEEAGATGVIIGKAIYEGKIALDDLRQFLRRASPC